MAVARAPRTEKDNFGNARSERWELFNEKCELHKPSLVFIDCNGRLGDRESGFLGSAGFAQTQDDNGDRLREMACNYRLYAANALFE